MGSLNIYLVLIIFIIASGVTWFAGIALTKTTDSLDTRFRIGDALGGLVLLGIAGSLPEIAIVASAALRGDVPVIVGNLIGGIAIQTLVLVIFDFAIKGKHPLSYLAGTITLAFETIFAIVITLLAVIGSKVPATRAILHFNPFSILIVVVWFIGLFLINKARENPKYNIAEEDAALGRRHKERRAVENHPFYAKKSTLHVVLIFLGAAIATLIAGVLLEETGVAIATRFGIGTGIFAATVLAFVTSLPEISTGLESIFIGDNMLAISDILGGNAFMIVIFFMADLLAKKPILSYADNQSILFGALGIGMMTVYAVTFIIKLKKRHFRLGWDSIFEILLYLVGVIALINIR
jgi:cation:H+ antiporter